MTKVEIHNVPEYAYGHKIIVYRECENGNWFYGAYDELEKAWNAAAFVQGRACEIENMVAV